VGDLEAEMQETLEDNQKLTVTDTIPNFNMAVISIEGNHDVHDIIKTLEKNDNIEYVEPNYIYYTDSINSTDPDRNLLW
jgi:hypothetical protein